MKSQGHYRVGYPGHFQWSPQPYLHPWATESPTRCSYIFSYSAPIQPSCRRAHDMGMGTWNLRRRYWARKLGRTSQSDARIHRRLIDSRRHGQDERRESVCRMSRILAEHVARRRSRNISFGRHSWIVWVISRDERSLCTSCGCRRELLYWLKTSHDTARRRQQDSVN